MLDLKDKVFFVAGVSNKKSVASFTVETLLKAHAKCILSVQNESQIAQANKLFPECPVFVCDVEKKDDLTKLNQNIKKFTPALHGFVHSMAFANFSEGPKPFHETNRADFLQAAQISAFSLVEITKELKSLLTPDASIVTISISDTSATSYGYMGPIKALLDSEVMYLAKSLSTDTQIRVNAVGAGPLKTSASAGIPNYIDNYLFAETLTLRKKALETQEVANTIVFLLSSMSSGINATTLRVDAGMRCNTFDEKVVKQFSKSL